MLCCLSAAPCRVCSLHEASVRSETDIWPIISRFSLILIVWLDAEVISHLCGWVLHPSSSYGFGEQHCQHEAAGYGSAVQHYQHEGVAPGRGVYVLLHIATTKRLSMASG